MKHALLCLLLVVNAGSYECFLLSEENIIMPIHLGIYGYDHILGMLLPLCKVSDHHGKYLVLLLDILDSKLCLYVRRVYEEGNFRIVSFLHIFEKKSYTSVEYYALSKATRERTFRLSSVQEGFF